MAFLQEVDLVLTADESRQTCRPDRLEAALGDRQAVDSPRGDWLGKTFYFVSTEITQTKQIAEQFACGCRYDDRPRLR